MSKKSVIILLIILAIIGLIGGFFVYDKYETRQERIRLMEQAKNTKAEEISLTFLEGWTNSEIGEYLEQQGVVKQQEFLNFLKTYKAENHDRLPTEAIGNLQGFLYPDTYRVFKSITDRNINSANDASKNIVEKQLTNLFKKLPDNAEQKAKAQNLSLYEVVILASIVEKESNNFPNEKSIIAGIFYNRLSIGMPLQSDATVNYATGKNLPSPSLNDLEINSPYNTYKNTGLPPTPISNPSIETINAVLSPQKTDYFYYLHNQKTGEPAYARTHEEHVANKQKHLR